CPLLGLLELRDCLFWSQRTLLDFPDRRHGHSRADRGDDDADEERRESWPDQMAEASDRGCQQNQKSGVGDDASDGDRCGILPERRRFLCYLRFRELDFLLHEPLGLVAQLVKKITETSLLLPDRAHTSSA